MFQVVASRYEAGSIVVTTNRKFRDWGKIFDVDNTLATAMIDRLMHHGEAIMIEGKIYRTNDDNESDDEEEGEDDHEQIATAENTRAMLELMQHDKASDRTSERAEPPLTQNKTALRG